MKLALRYIIAATVTVCLLTQHSSSFSQVAGFEECEQEPTQATAKAAFETHCGRCHEVKDLANDYFAEVERTGMPEREEDLAKFLDRHSACPHRHHEEIANWLRQLSRTD